MKRIYLFSVQKNYLTHTHWPTFLFVVNFSSLPFDCTKKRKTFFRFSIIANKDNEKMLGKRKHTQTKNHLYSCHNISKKILQKS